LSRTAIDFIQTTQNGTVPDTQVSFDPFQMTPLSQVLPTTQYNPYLEDTTNITSNGAAYYQPQTTYTAPAQPVSFNESDWTLTNITSSNIIFTRQSAPTEKIFWHISGSLMIYSCPRSSEKTCRRSRRQPCK
jgi:hypothetical protein